MLVPVLYLLCFCCCSVHLKPAVRGSDVIQDDISPNNNALKPADVVEEPTDEGDHIHQDTSEGEIPVLYEASEPGRAAPLLKINTENKETLNEQANPHNEQVHPQRGGNDQYQKEDEPAVLYRASEPNGAPPLLKISAENKEAVDEKPNPQTQSDDQHTEGEVPVLYGDSEPRSAGPPLQKLPADNKDTVNEQPNLQAHSDDQHVESEHTDTLDSRSVSSQNLQDVEMEDYFKSGGGEGAQQQPFQSGDVEELVHGWKGHVHDTSQSGGGDVINSDDVNVKRPSFDTFDVEHALYGDLNRHVQSHEDRLGADDSIKGRYEASNVERMVHGQDGDHVHSTDTLHHAQDPDHPVPYKVGDDDLLARVGYLNVHDPQSRNLLPTAGDFSHLTRSGNTEGEVGSEGSPTVVDTEHLMHGDGGHDHDVKQLKFLTTREDNDSPAQDQFNDMHGLLMHGGDDDAEVDKKTSPGKTITYKDIMELGLDEESFKGVDLNKLLLENARDYDDWQRDRQPVRGESPEGSFWEEVKQLRERYSNSGQNDETTTEPIYSTTTDVDPDQQRWATEIGPEEEEEDGEEE